MALRLLIIAIELLVCNYAVHGIIIRPQPGLYKNPKYSQTSLDPTIAVIKDDPVSPLNQGKTRGDGIPDHGVWREFDRRSFLRSGAAGISISLAGTIASNPSTASAAVTDATAEFADTDWVSPVAQVPSANKNPNEFVPSDEVQVRFDRKILQDRYQGRLGLELVDIEFRTNLRVRLKSVQAGSYAASLGVQPDWVVVSVNGIPTERTNAAGVRQYVSQAVAKSNPADDIVIVFRDPSIFQEKLRTLSSVESEGLPSVTTQVAPAGDTTQRNADGSVQAGRTVTTAVTDQRVTVQQLQAPRMCTRGAAVDDLMEISYTGSVVETGQIFDGSAVLLDGKGIPGRGNDVSLYFVLGKQPFGQFPPGWDVGLVGMCVGERRRLILPPALGYGSSGLPRRKIPPNATLQYDVTLVSLNGLATPQ